MKKLKKYIAVLLAFVLTVSVMPAGTLAAGAAEHVGNERITVVVMLDDGISPHDAAKRMAAATPCMKVKYIYDTLINGFAAEINSRDSGRLAGL